ncbi:MAG TPA: GDSL-type esterase/lipase family protein [Planococcus sp. (in: firmicutes)]|nr:GDSL-type esterase/lipase family protein [Planococcus sp. (in: firmicutes)]
MKTKQILLIASLALNVLLIGAAGIIVNKQGGIGFIEEQYDSIESKEEFPEYYRQKKDIFSALDGEAADKIFLGDSITDHGEFPEYFPDETVLNRGIAEDTTKGVLNRIDEVAARNPKEVYIMIGVNDIAAGVNKENYEKNMNKIVQSFDQEQTRVILQSLLPVNNNSFNNNLPNGRVDDFNVILKKVAADNNVEYVDLHTYFEDSNGQLQKEITIDGLHLMGEGYDIWIDQLEQQLP